MSKAHDVVVLGFFAILSVPIVAGLYFDMDLQRRASAEVEERIYTTACVRYKKADTWSRWTNPGLWKMGWCDKFIDRM
jgi:hypothetical protein